jgi:hypothetical protein
MKPDRLLDLPELCNVEDFARALGWSSRKLKAKLRDGQIPIGYIEIGGEPFWHRDVIRKYATTHAKFEPLAVSA